MTIQETQTDIRKNIIEKSCELFSEKGLEGVSVREIAQASGVNIAMISYYFGSKEGLYLECIANFAISKMESLKGILKEPTDTEDFKRRLRDTVQNKMDSFTEDLQAHKIIMREMQTKRDPTFQKKVTAQLFPIFDLMKDFFTAAKKRKIIKSDLDPEHLTIMLMGLLSHPCVCEQAMKLYLGYSMTESKVREVYVNNICEVFFSGMLK